jgi:hypothetical protein
MNRTTIGFLLFLLMLLSVVAPALDPGHAVDGKGAKGAPPLVLDRNASVKFLGNDGPVDCPNRASLDAFHKAMQQSLKSYLLGEQYELVGDLSSRLGRSRPLQPQDGSPEYEDARTQLGWLVFARLYGPGIEDGRSARKIYEEKIVPRLKNEQWNQGIADKMKQLGF